LDIAQLLPQFGNIAFTLAAFVLALSIIVAVHEYGHYIVGRWSGIHAEVFSLGFGPVLLSRVDRRGTRWQLAALPFGGYVKFLGDANAASVGGTAVDPALRRRTMLGAPLWARAATVAAGPVFNFILSLVVFTGIFLVQGQPADPLTIARLQPLPDSFVQELQPGDELVEIAGQPVGTIDALFAAQFPVAAGFDYTVRRDGALRVVQGPHPYPPVIFGLNPNSAAYDIDLRVGDVITEVDGVPVHAFSQLVDMVLASNGAPMQVAVWRGGEVLDFVLVPRRADLPRAEGGFETRWLVGISGGMLFEPQTVTPGVLSSVGAAAGQIWYIITSSLSGLWHMITGAISSCNLSGPVGIAQASGAMASQGVTSFIWFVALLSTAVGLLNLFPVPILDGGHLVFHAYEAVTGKLPGDKALRLLMAVGLSLILTLMVFALANDLFLCP